MTESTSPLSTPITAVTVETLHSMGACLSGINKFTKAQRDAGPNAKLSQIAEHISLNYILWAIKRIDKKLYRMLACDYAEHTLHLFESKYPQDMRPRNAIVAGRKVAAYAATAEAVYAAADAADAADATYAAYAADAAYAAAYAAAEATYATYATYAAVYAATYAAYAATYAAYAAYAADAADAATYAADAAYATDVAADAYAAAYAYAADVAAYAADAAYAAAAVDAADAAKQNEKQWQHSHTIKIIQAYESNTLDWNRMSLTESITIL